MPEGVTLLALTRIVLGEDHELVGFLQDFLRGHCARIHANMPLKASSPGVEHELGKEGLATNLS